jgi:hypothetical protein
MPNDTPCKECIFAIYDGITQTDCKLNKLDLFRHHGTAVLEAYDDEKEFFVILHKKCMWFRPSAWKYANENENIQQAQLDKELKIQYQAIIFADEEISPEHVTKKNPMQIIADVVSTLNSLEKQTIPPKHITIIRKPTCSVKPSEFVSLFDGVNYKWRVENIIDPNAPEGSMIDYVLDVKPHPYYAVFRSGFKVPSDTFETLNKHILDHLEPISILLPNNTNNGLIVFYALHKILQGHHDCGIEHKLYNNDVIKVNPIDVKRITDLCPNFPT